MNVGSQEPLERVMIALTPPRSSLHQHLRNKIVAA